MADTQGASFKTTGGDRVEGVVLMAVDGSTGIAAPSAAVGGSVSTPFQPIVAATVALTVSATATTAPVALPANTATVYRIRNAPSSASAVAWRLNTSTPGTAPVIPTAYSAAGTGGVVGDKMIDPGGVEVFALSSAQQTALLAGTLYLSAITPTGGSATIYLTPGTAGV